MTRWPWVVRGYYAENVQPPKEPGALAVEVRGASAEALAMDVRVFELRPDIGAVEGPVQVVA